MAADGRLPLTTFWHDADGIFDRLTGTWCLARTIDGMATMTGIAQFERQPADMLGYAERGRIRLASGDEFEAHRTYRFTRSRGGFSVYFDEEPLRLFHTIVLERDADVLTGGATHPCTPDTYRSSYHFFVDGTFAIRHTVRGPRKAYVSSTIFSRRSD